MGQEEKSKFSFASVAVSFFILIVLPLTITGIVISKGVVKVGEEATQANLRILDDSQKQAIQGLAKDVADAIAQFYAEREKDIKIASILPRDEKAYKTFLDNNLRGIIKSTGDAGIVKVSVPIYKEIAFFDRTGKLTLKATVTGIEPNSDLEKLINSKNNEIGYSASFEKAKKLQPGDFYISPVIGLHVNKAEFDSGNRFKGVEIFASPVFDSNGFAGVVELVMNFEHVREFIDHIIPTDIGKSFVNVDIANKDYSFLVNRDGILISAPADYMIGGFDKDSKQIQALTNANAKELLESGNVTHDFKNLEYPDEKMVMVNNEALAGKAGNIEYKDTLTGSIFFVAYANVTYYGNGYIKPAGLGWVGMIIDVDKYHKLSQEKVKEIQGKIARWQKSSITVVIVSLILLFLIALILSRGIHRQIKTAYTGQTPPRYDEEDEK